MKVVIMCGGLGTRLREETEFKPKPMVHIGQKPILWHIMKIYSHYGYNDFVLCLGYRGEMIKEYFFNYELLNSDFTITFGKDKNIDILTNGLETKWKVTLADTGEESLKGARLKKVEKYIDGDSFMYTYGDGVGNIDIASLVEFHRKHGKLATLTGVNPAARFGKLTVEGDRVTKFTEKKNVGTERANGGFFVFNKEIFDYLNTDDRCDLEVGTLDKIAEEGKLMVYNHSGFWACMDTLRDVDYLNGLWGQGRAAWKVW
jgi:glucose-1-phosphate cytidylyltransferase